MVCNEFNFFITEEKKTDRENDTDRKPDAVQYFNDVQFKFTIKMVWLLCLHIGHEQETNANKLRRQKAQNSRCVCVKLYWTTYHLKSTSQQFIAFCMVILDIRTGGGMCVFLIYCFVSFHFIHERINWPLKWQHVYLSLLRNKMPTNQPTKHHFVFVFVFVHEFNQFNTKNRNKLKQFTDIDYSERWRWRWRESCRMLLLLNLRKCKQKGVQPDKTFSK